MRRLTPAGMEPAQALRLIADSPDARPRTGDDLETLAGQCLADANRKVRAASGRSKRRRVEAAHEAMQLRGHAMVCNLAAEEVERRGCRTVGQAISPAIVRLVRRVIGR